MTKENISKSKGDGLKLQHLRNSLGLTLDEFAQKTDINPSFLNLLERGYLDLSSRDKRKIIEAFRIQENWFEIQINDNYIEKPSSPKLGTEEQLVKSSMIISDGETLKSSRIAVGLSRRDIAQAIGITPVQIGYIETGKRNLTEKVKKKLNDYFVTNFINSQNSNTKEKENIINLKNAKRETKTVINVISNDEILDKIMLIKRENGYSQTDISKKSGVNRSQLCMIENRKAKISKKVKAKLLQFITSELECISHEQEIEVHKPTKGAIELTESKHQIENEKNIIQVMIDREELIQVIEYLKNTRDGLTDKINRLEKALDNM